MLGRLRVPFDVRAPDVDEAPWHGEAPADLAKRLALAKAQAVAQTLGASADVVVIGSDQVADHAGQSLGKPFTFEAAVVQLQQMRGHTVVFQTAVAVVRPRTGYAGQRLVPVSVQFRHVSDAQIKAYLLAEQPYDCAGSAKSEGLGIALLSAIHSDDPTALVGLPLIATCDLLREAGLDPLDHLSPP